MVVRYIKLDYTEDNIVTKDSTIYSHDILHVVTLNSMIYDIKCLTYVGYTEDNIHSYLHIVSKKLLMHYFWTGIKIKHMQGGNISINLHNTLVASDKFTWNASNKLATIYKSIAAIITAALYLQHQPVQKLP